jgi:hypothetical protein
MRGFKNFAIILGALALGCGALAGCGAAKKTEENQPASPWNKLLSGSLSTPTPQFSLKSLQTKIELSPKLAPLATREGAIHSQVLSTPSLSTRLNFSPTNGSFEARGAAPANPTVLATGPKGGEENSGIPKTLAAPPMASVSNFIPLPEKTYPMAAQDSSVPGLVNSSGLGSSNVSPSGGILARGSSSSTGTGTSATPNLGGVSAVPPGGSPATSTTANSTVPPQAGSRSSSGAQNIGAFSGNASLADNRSLNPVSQDSAFQKKSPPSQDPLGPLDPAAASKKPPQGPAPAQLRSSTQFIVASDSGGGTLEAPSVHGSATWQTILGNAYGQLTERLVGLTFGGERGEIPATLELPLPLQLSNQPPAFPEGEVRAAGAYNVPPPEAFKTCKECADSFVRVIDCGPIKEEELKAITAHTVAGNAEETLFEKFHLELFSKLWANQETTLCPHPQYFDLEISLREKTVPLYSNYLPNQPDKKMVKVFYYHVDTQKVPIQVDGMYYVFLVQKEYFRPNQVGSLSLNAFAPLASPEMLFNNMSSDQKLLRLVRVKPGKFIPFSPSP